MEDRERFDETLFGIHRNGMKCVSGTQSRGVWRNWSRVLKKRHRGNSRPRFHRTGTDTHYWSIEIGISGNGIQSDQGGVCRGNKVIYSEWKWVRIEWLRERRLDALSGHGVGEAEFRRGRGVQVQQKPKPQWQTWPSYCWCLLVPTVTFSCPTAVDLLPLIEISVRVRPRRVSTNFTHSAVCFSLFADRHQIKTVVGTG